LKIQEDVYEEQHQKSECISEEEEEQLEVPESLKDIFKISNRNRKRNKQKKKHKMGSGHEPVETVY